MTKPSASYIWWLHVLYLPNKDEGSTPSEESHASLIYAIQIFVSVNQLVTISQKRFFFHMLGN